uniref:Uncharacterized protein n=1 Tax=Dunaliella tertiolecta TaxID=3047 RepID=A0A7S3QRZ5_DUNTE|mmetsp:Transcript_25881/g.70166  ORF Transcript_25881/g.70166 Transcript_25881/m.70166 type:complete len:116 (-) Transcript_25881:938-1285(-)|eukprot:CAMPEP_0202362720 /NCGR_PEP_ID=MMETSP1126-20121109/14797_1 /ASSEMBLY_ACC=CAM_ASM_000457 /TAXON_ID=3047 /ORGANISM="Dunaliella tertiolecta, Strain CCMP1320" /LENGTH=115 /DNA_ID=CAMNT_0048956983 /DNA_START=105 /DNA_END=452 /DNA_ORIENTATION=-
MAQGEAPNPQAVRDTRRVLQVLLGNTLPPPAIEMACNTFFASTSLTQKRGSNQSRASQGKEAQRTPSGRYTLKRMDSGDFSQLSLTSPPGKTGSRHFEDTNMLQFNLPEEKRTKR